MESLLGIVSLCNLQPTGLYLLIYAFIATKHLGTCLDLKLIILRQLLRAVKIFLYAAVSRAQSDRSDCREPFQVSLQGEVYSGLGNVDNQ